VERPGHPDRDGQADGQIQNVDVNDKHPPPPS
jgi:hypothetical protein